jgi:hypothetical protein
MTNEEKKNMRRLEGEMVEKNKTKHKRKGKKCYWQ